MINRLTNGVGVGMLRGSGDSLTQKLYSFPGCLFLLVSWFSVSWFISDFRRFNDPTLPNFHFMFLIYTNLNFRLQDFLYFIRRIAGIFGTRIFHKFQNFGCPKCGNFKNKIDEMVWFSWIIWRILVSQQVNNIVLGPVDTSKNPDITKMRGLMYFQ